MYLASDLKYKFTLKILKYFSLTTVLILCFTSCKKDDDGSVDSIPANVDIKGFSLSTNFEDTVKVISKDKKLKAVLI